MCIRDSYKEIKYLEKLLLSSAAKLLTTTNGVSGNNHSLNYVTPFKKLWKRYGKTIWRRVYFPI